jgi:hypothetical protein
MGAVFLVLNNFIKNHFYDLIINTFKHVKFLKIVYNSLVCNIKKTIKTYSTLNGTVAELNNKFLIVQTSTKN